jgi:hypothetical protein
MTQAVLLLVVLAMAGCASIGPAAVTRDRFDYTGAVAESWKSQMLLNLVKIRYGDTPVFLDIGQIVAGYSFQRSVTASANASAFNSGPLPGAVIGTFGASAQGTYNDSPTITYTPLAGERFARSLMMPIPPSAILNVIQAGFSADVVFRLTVQAVNGVDNRRVEPQYVRPADPEFYVLLRDLRRVQAAGDIGVRLDRVDKDERLHLLLRPNLPAAVENAGLSVATILGLDPATPEFRVVYGAVAPS